MFWRLFAGVVLGVVVLVVLVVYQQLVGQVRDLQSELSALSHDLRKDLVRLSENHGAMIKKDDHNGKLRTVWDTVKELRADRSDLTTLKERCNILSEQCKACEEERKALLGEVRGLREKQASQGEKETLIREIRAIRERIAGLEGKGPPSVVPAGHAEEQSRE